MNLNLNVQKNSIVLDWDAPAFAPEGYKVYRMAPGDKGYQELVSISTNTRNDSTSYTDRSLSRAGTYSYIVKSLFESGKVSQPSVPVSVHVRQLTTATEPASTGTATSTDAASATPTVTNTPGGPINVNGSCSLPNAIRAANTDAASGGCPAGSGADTINLSADIVLSASLPDVTSAITIEGGYYQISMPGTVRMVKVAATGNLRLSRVRATKSSNARYSGHGGFIENKGTLQLDRSSLTYSRQTEGGSIYNTGTMTIDSSFIRASDTTGNGGAIVNEGTATIRNSTITESLAREGGAIVTDNGGVTTIINTTMYKNNVRPPRYYSSAVWTGFRPSQIYIYNSIMAGSSATHDCRHYTFDWVMENTYLEGGCGVGGYNIGASSGEIKVGSLITPADGSPPYFPLLAGSVGIGAGDPARCPATDQLGNARPSPGQTKCDLGAVEVALLPPTATATQTATFTPTATPLHSPTPRPNNVRFKSTDCNLRDAIAAANYDSATGRCPAGSGEDTITLTTNITLDTRLPDATSKFTIDGAYYTFSMPGTVQMIRIKAGGDLRLTRVRATKSDRVQFSGNGGFIENDGTLRVDKSSFRGSRHRFRGAIRNRGTLTVDSSFFGDNHAQWFGGAIRTSGTATIKNSTFSENSSRQGGAINVNVGGSITIINSTFYRNTDNYVDASSLYFGMMGRSAHIYNSIMAGSNANLDCKAIQLDFRLVNSYVEDGCSAHSPTAPSSGNLNLGALVEPADGSPPYYPLLANSVALGAGDAARCPATDQLGNTRPNPSGENCDLGAVESSLPPPPRRRKPTRPPSPIRRPLPIRLPSPTPQLIR